jgi:hypothetical protein
MLRLVFLACALLILIAFKAEAAAVWNADPLRYHKYDVTPNNLTDGSYKYLVNTDAEAVNINWKRIGGTWIKYTTVAGGVKYAEEVIINQPPAGECNAVVCRDDFGVTIYLAKLTVYACPKVKITTADIQFYEGLRIIDGVPVCHKL